MKAVYYCRVSTDEEKQLNALEVQIEQAIECIQKNGWDLIDGYIDEGKSGTDTKNRNEYNRLYNDLNTTKFDIIVIKSQDRLMRNVKDWYLFVDKLVTNNKKLYIYLENRFYTPDDALISGIKAILAEEYSRELSKKISNRHKKRQETGSNIVLTSATWGYDKINKQIVINEKEADIVRLIYDLYIQGYGSRSISKELSNRGIKNRNGKDFAEGVIRQIIRNPLYMGTVIMNKRSYIFESKKTVRNPKEEWIYHENAVPAIVSKEIWEKANRIMDQRSKYVRADEFAQRKVGVNLGKYNLSSKIICGECGSVYWRRYRKNTKGEQIIDWSCSEYVQHGRKNKIDPRGKEKIKVKYEEGGCDNVHIKNEDIENILLEVAKTVFNQDRSKIINKLLSELKKEFSKDNVNLQLNNLQLEREKILNQKNLLLDKLLEGIISNDDYKRKNNELEKRLQEIEIKEIELKTNIDKYKDIEDRINDIKKALTGDINDEVNKEKLIKHIKKITVFQDHLTIELDFFKPININFKKQGKKFLYVLSTKYLIPHTDKYRYDGKYKEVNVKIAI